MTFGYKCAWFAVRSRAIEPVANEMLEHPTSIAWSAGCAAAYEGDRFVTPPTRGWVLIASTAFFDLVQGGDLRAELERLSSQFGEAQFFATDRVIGLVGYGRARHGKLLRAFGELDGAVSVDQGRAGVDEKRVFRAGRDEDTVMALAGAWSVDPQTLRHATGMTTGAPAPVAAGKRRIAVGKKAPAFDLRYAVGGNVKSSALAGRPYVLHFYAASVPSTARAFQAQLAAFEKLGTVVLGVSDDREEVTRNRYTSHDPVIDTLIADVRMLGVYGAWGEHATWDAWRGEQPVIGVLRSTVLVGNDGVVVDRWTDITDIQQHVADVLAAAKALESRRSKPQRSRRAVARDKRRHRSGRRQVSVSSLSARAPRKSSRGCG